MEEERNNIIKAITTPLGFFALSLLIVEGFLGIVLGFTKVDDLIFYFTGMIVGAFLFILVVAGVWALVWFHPESIVKAGTDYIKEKELDLENSRLVDEIEKSRESTTKNIRIDNYYDANSIAGDSAIARLRNNRWISSDGGYGGGGGVGID